MTSKPTRAPSAAERPDPRGFEAPELRTAATQLERWLLRVERYKERVEKGRTPFSAVPIKPDEFEKLVAVAEAAVALLREYEHGETVGEIFVAGETTAAEERLKEAVDALDS